MNSVISSEKGLWCKTCGAQASIELGVSYDMMHLCPGSILLQRNLDHEDATT